MASLASGHGSSATAATSMRPAKGVPDRAVTTCDSAAMGHRALGFDERPHERRLADVLGDVRTFRFHPARLARLGGPGLVLAVGEVDFERPSPRHVVPAGR